MKKIFNEFTNKSRVIEEAISLENGYQEIEIIMNKSLEDIITNEN